jgi:hypothetical protein
MYTNLRTDGVASVGAGYTTVERIGMRDGGGFVARETSAYQAGNLTHGYVRPWAPDPNG